jgi:hypothetical protein
MNGNGTARLLPRERLENVERRMRNHENRPLYTPNGDPIPYPDLELDADDFITAARDNKGGSIKNSFWCTPLLNSIMEQFVSCGKFSFRNKADYQRTACEYFARVLDKLVSDPVVADSLAVLRTMNKMLADQQKVAEAVKFIADAQTKAADQQRLFGPKYTVRQMKKVMIRAQAIPDDEIRARCVAELQIVIDGLSQ